MARPHSTVRSLKPGEALPSGEPNRYLMSGGYVILRWKIAKYQYVEVYEHRVDGNRVTMAPKVMRLNGERKDNREKNLSSLTIEQQCDEHLASLNVDPAPFVHLFKSGWTPEQVAQDMKRPVGLTRRILKRAGMKVYAPQIPATAIFERDREEIMGMHEAGVSWKKIAIKYGMGSSVVNKIFTKWGVEPNYRPFNEPRCQAVA